MTAMGSDWVKNWKSLKILFFKTTGWNETKIGSNNTLVVPIKIMFMDPVMADYVNLIFKYYLKFLTSDLTTIFIFVITLID